MSEERLFLGFTSNKNRVQKLKNGTTEEVDLNNIKLPFVLKDKLLINEGVHNGGFYPAEELKKSVWQAEGAAMYYDHDNKASTWLGVIKNARWDEESKGQRGDIHIVDADLARKLAFGAKLGISATVDVDKTEGPDGKDWCVDPQFLSYDVVLEPAVRETMLNSKGGTIMSEEGEDKKKDSKTLEGEGEGNAKEGEGEAKKEDGQEDSQNTSEGTEQNSQEQNAGDEGEENKKKDKKKKYPYPEDEEEMDKELEKELKDELSAYTDFVKKYLKDNPGKSIKDAAAAWKKRGKMEEENQTLKAELEALKKEKLKSKVSQLAELEAKLGLIKEEELSKRKEDLLEKSEETLSEIEKTAEKLSLKKTEGKKAERLSRPSEGSDNTKETERLSADEELVLAMKKSQESVAVLD